VKHLEQQGLKIKLPDVQDLADKLKAAKRVRLWRAEYNFDECFNMLQRLQELSEQVQHLDPPYDDERCTNGRCLQTFLHPGGTAQTKCQEDNFHSKILESIAQLKEVVEPVDAVVSRVYDKSLQLIIRYSRKDQSLDGKVYLQPPSSQNPRIAEVLDDLEYIVSVILKELRTSHTKSRAREIIHGNRASIRTNM